MLAAAPVESWEGAEVVVVGGPVTVVWMVKGEVRTTVPFVLVAVFSDGTVMTSVTGTEVSKVMGT